MLSPKNKFYLDVDDLIAQLFVNETKSIIGRLGFVTLKDFTYDLPNKNLPLS